MRGLAIRFDKNRQIADDAEKEQLQDLLEESTDRHDRTGPFKTLGRIAGVVNRTYAERNTASIEKSQDDLRERLSEIAVVAFIGPSGTGKSTRAIAVARQYKIDYLIDDGLLVHGSRIVAGSSAKRAKSKLDSVRQALFADENRAQIMRNALASHLPTTLMILGTSDGMLEKICKNLWLNPPAMLIKIEDVSSDEEMHLAKQTRISQGKHTIPVPSMEIKHEFSGYFADPFFRLRRRLDRDRAISITPESDRTVVRPTFSSLGRYSISDDAMRMLIELILVHVEGVAGLIGFATENESSGVVVTLELSVYYGYNAQQVLRDVQVTVSNQIEEYTSINVLAVNAKARRVVHKKNEARPQSSFGSPKP